MASVLREIIVKKTSQARKRSKACKLDFEQARCDLDALQEKLSAFDLIIQKRMKNDLLRLLVNRRNGIRPVNYSLLVLNHSMYKYV